jgi:V8-like Glu-specific endopeptidase
MLLMFDGYYAGVGFRNYMFFSIPTKPGSSGSPILNEKGELVSMIFAGFPAMENIGLGSNLNNIRTFVVDTIVASEMDSWAKKNMNRDTTETMTTEPPKP